MMRYAMTLVMLSVCLVAWECTADELGDAKPNPFPSVPPPPPPVHSSPLQGSSSQSDPSPRAADAHSPQDDGRSSSSTSSSSMSSSSTSSSASTALSSSVRTEGDQATTTTTEAVKQSVEDSNPTDRTDHHEDTERASELLLAASSHTLSGSEAATKDGGLTVTKATEKSGQDARGPTPTSSTTITNAEGAHTTHERIGEKDSRTQTLNAQGQRNTPTAENTLVPGTSSTPNMQSPPERGAPVISKDHSVERDTTPLNPTLSTAHINSDPSQTSPAATRQGTGISTNGTPPTVNVITPPGQHLNQKKPKATSSGERQAQALAVTPATRITKDVGKNTTTPTNAAATQGKDKAPVQNTPTATIAGEVHVTAVDPSANKHKSSSKDLTTTTTPAENAEVNRAAATTGEKEVNTAQTSVPSMTQSAKLESTAAANQLPKLPNALQQMDLNDGSTDSFSLSGFTALVALAVMAAAPVF